MTLRFLLPVVALAVSACATPNIPTDFALGNSAAGVATGSITYDGDYAGYKLDIDNSSTGQRFVIEHGSAQTLNPLLAFQGEKPDPELRQTGSPFAVELPPGNYVVRSWQVSQGYANVVSTTPTGIQFEIKPHEAIYLGNFHFHETSRIVRAISGATVTLSDQSARDLPAIRSEFKALGTVSLTQSLAPNAKFTNIGGAGAGSMTPIFVPIVR